MNDAEAIALALEEAKSAAARGEVPVGAVLLSADGALLARDGNRILELKDPTAHAEMLVLRAGAKVLNNERLIGAGIGLITAREVLQLGFPGFSPGWF